MRRPTPSLSARLARVGIDADLLRVLCLTLLGFLALFVSWHLVAVQVVRSVLFPPPMPVLHRAMEMLADGSLLSQVWPSLQRILAGFFLGSIAGIAIGLVAGSFETLRRLLDPFVETLRFIPAVAMITVAVIWFGIGEGSKIFIIFYSTLFIVLITTVAGVRNIPVNKLRAAQSLGAARWQVFCFVIAPSAVPFMLTGMRVGMANAFTTIVAAEMVAANSGIGAVLWKARLFMQVNDIFVALLTLAALGFLIDRLFRWLITMFAGRYSPLL